MNIFYLFILTYLFYLPCYGNADSLKKDQPLKPVIDYPEAITLGFTEGLTEYLPISSLGHLILMNEMLQLNQETPAISLTTQNPLPITQKMIANTYVIGLQIGAISAVGYLYFSTFLGILMGLLGKSPAYRQLGIHLIIAFLPAACLGLILHHWIEAHFFTPRSIAYALLIGGIIILFFEKYQKKSLHHTKSLCHLNIKNALWIGLFQCLALIPGTSRSLATIVGCVFNGLSKADAAKFSFLLGFITLSAASLYTCLSINVPLTEIFTVGPFITGFIISFITAILSIRWFIHFISKQGLYYFGYYRILLAIVLFYYFPSAS